MSVHCGNLAWHDKRDDINASPMTTRYFTSFGDGDVAMNWHIRGSTKNIFGLIVFHCSNSYYSFRTIVEMLQITAEQACRQLLVVLKPAHYDDVIMTTIASQITSLTVVYSTVYSDADQSKHQKLRVTGLCVGNSPGPVNSPHKGPVTRKMFPFDDVIMSQFTKYKLTSTTRFAKQKTSERAVSLIQAKSEQIPSKLSLGKAIENGPRVWHSSYCVYSCRQFILFNRLKLW